MSPFAAGGIALGGKGPLGHAGPSGKTISHLSNHETTLLSFFSVQGSSQTAVGVLPQRVPRRPPARPLREQATWWRGRKGSRRLHLSRHDTPVAHLNSPGAAELKLGRELAPRRPCDLHRKTADNSAARGGLVMDQRGRRRFEGNRYGACDATPCSSRRLV